MTFVRSAVQAIWEFVVGDDWLTAFGVCAALGVVAIFAGLDITAWWVMPLAVVGLLWASLRRFTQTRNID